MQADCRVPLAHVGASAPARVQPTAVGNHLPLLQGCNSADADHQAELKHELIPSVLMQVVQPKSMWSLAAPRDSSAVRLHWNSISASQTCLFGDSNHDHRVAKR